MFIVALFLMAKTWKQSWCHSIGERVNGLWCIQTKEYYSVLKRNEPSNPEKTQRKFKCIWLSGKSQFFKSFFFKMLLSNYMTFWKRQNCEDSKKISDSLIRKSCWLPILQPLFILPYCHLRLSMISCLDCFKSLIIDPLVPIFILSRQLWTQTLWFP